MKEEQDRGPNRNPHPKRLWTTEGLGYYGQTLELQIGYGGQPLTLH